MKVIKYAILTLYVVITGVLGYATFLGQAEGAGAAATHIYHTPWFCLLWALLVLSSGIYLTKRKLYRQLPLCLLHLSFVIILIGAMITFLFGKKGSMHLRQGEASAAYITQDKHIGNLPFQLTLDRFQVKYYPGTHAPSDFISHIHRDGADGQREKAVISMNNIYRSHGYRFYQSSFDTDMKGTVLSVNYDPWGTGVTYFGYALLALSMFLTLFDRHQEFRRLLNSPALRRGLCLLAICSGVHQTASARSIPTINGQKAEEVARYQVVYNDRIVPLNTVAIDFMRKVYGKTSYKGLSAEQVIYGWMARPEVWKEEKMIRIKNRELRKRLGINGQYASMQDLFDADGQYRLMSMVQQEQAKDAMGKALRETDEKAGLILMLVNRTLFTPLSPDEPHLDEPHVEAEILYNRIPFTAILFMLNLTVGFLCFFFLLYSVTRQTKKKISAKISVISTWVLFFSFTFALCGYILRWYIGGRIPLSNGYETMLLLGLLVMGITLLLHRRFRFITPFGMLLSGFALLVSHLGQMNPQITPLMPVLHSPLLSLHVSVIMAAYALLAFMMLGGIFACILILRPMPATMQSEKESIIRQLTTLSRLMLYPAVFLLAIGIFLGAVWANVSWGSYWSWDPKETWALITLMVYGVAFHDRSLPFLRNDLYFHLYLTLAFLTVLMTYFGVNFFMSGMHSYA